MSMSLRPSITPWGGAHLLFATPRECSWISMKTSGILLHILQICTSYFIHLYLIIFNFFAFPLFQWNFYVKTSGGTHLVSTIPPKSVGGFQWKFQTFFYIHWRCTPKGYANAIWDLIIFNCFGFPYWKMDFVIPYLRGYSSLIHYPSLTCEWISMKHV